jgi:stage II sporulation protein D
MLLKNRKPLRYAGAAFLLALLSSCAPVSPYHVSRQPEPFIVNENNGAQTQAISREGLRVLLRRGSNGLKLHCRGGIRLLDPANGSSVIEFGPATRAQLLASAGQLVAGGKPLGLREALLAPIQSEDALIVGDCSYRGHLVLKASGDALLLVNEVSLDEYLYGVVPGEIGSSWPMEALKAQAVAARTYAIYRAAESNSSLYDLDDSTRSQVYFGRSKEAARTCQAVDQTARMILTWHGKAAATFFHANSGGHTADAASVWGTAVPYLEGVDDPYCKGGAHYAWHSDIDQDVLLGRLERAGVHLRDFDSIETTEIDASGRCQKVRFLGAERNAVMSGQAFRIAMGPDVLCSTIFRVSRHGDTEHFEGRGWGHGVGLSQEGALEMAKQGYRYGEILDYYFPGTHLQILQP